MRFTLPFFVSALAAAFLVCGCNRSDDGAKTYIVPNEASAPAHPTPAEPPNMAAMPASDIPVNSAHVTWTTPATWQELAPTSIRIGNFAIAGQNGAKAEVAIFSFPGSVGTELDNVNRWRNELKLPPVDSDKITSEPVTIDSSGGKLYEISGSSAMTVVASLPREGATWFIKMRGDKDVVAAAKPAFQEFLKSIHFNGAATETPPASVLNAAAASPHGDLTAATQADNSADRPQFIVPQNWIEKTPGPMLLKSYDVVIDSGKTAAATISVFPGDVGGAFRNVNRWRAQMSLPEIEEGQLGSMTQPLETSGGKATMVDFNGTDSKTSQPAELVAVMVPHGDSTWFYKLLGDSSVVTAQKDSFLKFVQTIRYP